LTGAYTNGKLVKRRRVFRIFNDILKANKGPLHEMIENQELQMDNKTLVTILSWAEEASPLRVISKEQR